MAMEELLEDGVDLPDHTSLDLATAREATYVFHNEVTYEYPAPIRALRHQFVVLPRHRHGDQRRVTHRVHADVPQRALVHHRYDRFGNPVVAVRAPRSPSASPTACAPCCTAAATTTPIARGVPSTRRRPD